MTSLRRLLLDHRTLALGLALAALAVRLLVPAGFMLGQMDGRPILQICSGFGAVTTLPSGHAGAHAGMAMADHATMPEAGDHHDRGGESDAGGHATADMPCAYAALAHGAVAATDIVLLAGAIAFVIARGCAPRPARRLRSVANLRPPLRGPPVAA